MNVIDDKTVYEVFKERGFIEQVTDEEKIPEVLTGTSNLLHWL